MKNILKISKLTLYDSLSSLLAAAIHGCMGAGFVCFWWQIQARITVKEAVRHQHEPSADNWLDRKIFHANGMVQTKHVPSYNVLIFCGAFLLGPHMDSITTVGVVHKSPSWITLFGVIGCHPKLFVDKGHAFTRRTVRVREGTDAVGRFELVRSGFAHASGLFVTGEPPKAFFVAIADTPSFRGNWCLDQVKGIAVRIYFRVIRHLDGIAFLDSIFVPVNTPINTGTKMVLMNLSKNTRHDFSAVLAAFEGLTGHCVDDTSGFHFKFNSAIQLEIPITCILVIANGGNERNHKTTTASNFGVIGPEIPTLSQQGLEWGNCYW